mgnify:CR=1 FL=1
MDYQATVEYLYSLLPAYQRVGRGAFKKDLTNIRALCKAFGNPHLQFRSIHVGGTNGKGSVSSMLSSIFWEAGLQKVGLYTSPHLLSFTERIRINGNNVPEDWVVDFVARAKGVIEDVQPSFFEFTVLMAFQYFAEQEVDVAVVEVGLGGRLDSTNIVKPEISVITNVGLDHADMLGPTLEKIAHEKAGIIKPETPVVVGQTVPETRPVFEQKAIERSAPLRFANHIYNLVPRGRDWHAAQYDVFKHDNLHIEDLVCDLAGEYQSANLATTLAAVDAINEETPYDLQLDAVRRGLKAVRKNSGLRGRMEVLQREPLVVTDVAHNQDGLGAVFDQLRGYPPEAIQVIFGMAADKDLVGHFRYLPKNSTYYFVKPNVPRGMPARRLMLLAKRFNIQGKHFTDFGEAMQAAYSQVPENGIIVITGSVFLTADALAWYEQMPAT